MENQRNTWSRAGALMGFGVGGLLGYFFDGHFFPWNVIALGLGLVLGRAKDRPGS